MTRRRWLFVALMLAGGSASATNCTVSSVNLAFGGYNPFRVSHTDSNGNVAVMCYGALGDTVAYTLTLSPGSSGTPALRRMRYGKSMLSYNLFTTPTRTTIWGDGNAGSVIVSDTMGLTGSNITRNYTVYGRTFARQNVLVGNYTDSIVVTLNF